MIPPAALDLTPLLKAIEDACKREELPPLLMLLGTLDASRKRCLVVIGRLMGGEPMRVSPRETVTTEPDQALTAGQCARLSGWKRQAPAGERAGFSPRWFYDHADELPFRIGGPRRQPVRFSKRGYNAWLAAR